MSKPLYLTDYLSRNANTIAAKPALVCADLSLSWSELAQRVEQAAVNLSRHLDSEEQQVVGLLFSNTWEFVVSYLAIVQTGHIALPLDPTYKKLELDAIIRQVKPVAVITGASYKDRITYDNILLFDDLAVASQGAVQQLRLDPKEQIASLTFTSGTTGKPKLAPYTHAGYIWNVKVCSKVWRWTAKDNLLISVPLSHWYGLAMGLAGALYHGNTLYLHEWFDPKTTLEALSSGNISLFTHFPLVYAQMLGVENYEQYDLSKTRLFISGGAALPPTIGEEFKARFGVDILECYGSSETGRIAANSAKDHVPGSPGRLLDEVELRLSPEGEVLVRSPGVFPGYFHNPGATAENLDQEGWWYTGDLGQLEAGRLFLKGRVHERIRRFGYSLSPRDIEWALHQFSKIKDVHVMGRQQPDQPNDELIYFVNTQATVKEIKEYCKLNLPYAWRPDRIVLMDPLPRTRSGKTRLSTLNQLLEEQVLVTGGSY